MKTLTTRSLARSPRRALRMAVAVAALALIAIGDIGSPAIAAEAPPALSVSLSNSIDEVAPDSSFDYVAVLESSGPATELKLAVTVPEFAEIVDAADAKIEGHTASWTVTVVPGTPVSLAASVRVGAIPADTLWANAAAEVVVTGSTEIAVGASDVDPVAGTESARADAQKAAKKALAEQLASDARDGDGGSLLGSVERFLPVLIGGAIAVLVLAGASILLWLRNRRRAAAAEHGGGDLDQRGTATGVSGAAAVETRASRRASVSDARRATRRTDI